MSSQNFESLEDDFIALKDKIKRRLDNDVSKMYGETRKNTLREIQREMDELQHVFMELEDEAKQAPLPYRSHLVTKLRSYNIEVSAIKRKITSCEEATNSAKRELFSKNRSDGDWPNAEIRRNQLHLINNTIVRTNESVFHAQQIAVETGQVGIEVVDELGTQRESLLRTKERLIDTDENLTTSRKILRSMYRKVITNKLILIVAIVLEIAILAAEVYYKFFS